MAQAAPRSILSLPAARLCPPPARAFAPNAASQLTSSWGKVGMPLASLLEAQGALDARIEAAPFCQFRSHIWPTQGRSWQVKLAAAAASQGLSLTSGHPTNPIGHSPRATGPGWLWAGRTRHPFPAPRRGAEANGRPGCGRAFLSWHAASAACTLHSGVGATARRRTRPSRASAPSCRALGFSPPPHASPALSGRL